MRTHILFMTLVLIFTVLVFSTDAAAVDAQITDRTGAKTIVSNLKSHRHDSCGGFMYYLGVATETDFYYDFLPVKTGEYEVQIPFEIIKLVTVQEKTDPKDTWRKSYLYNIFLSDGTEIKGELRKVSEFTGASDLGAFKIATGGVKEIVFTHKPSLSFNATSCGKNKATLVLSDGSQLLLNGVAFVNEKKNRNGCYIGEEECLYSMKFKAGETEYDIEWGKISSIVFGGSEKFKLVAKTGSELVGTAQNTIGAEGIATIGHFKLRVIVPFDSKASKLTF
jgi:hypothetical protein